MGRARKTIAALIPLLVTLATFEYGFEWILGHSHLFQFSANNIFRAYYLTHDRRIVIYEPGCGRYDPGLTYTFQPGQCVFHNREFTVSYMNNTAGLRDDEASLHAPGIIVVGDSHASGWGVEQDLAFPQRVQQITGINVLNAGVPSYGTAREMKLLERLDTSKLQYLVIQYCNNDTSENKSYVEHNGDLPVSTEAAFNASKQEALAAREYYPLKHLFYTVHFLYGKLRQVTSNPDKENGVFTDEKMANREQRHAERFLRIVSEARALPANTRILVIAINGVGNDDQLFNTSLRELLANPPAPFASIAHRIQVIDLPLSSPRDYFALDEHINPAGHDVVARTLVKAIKADQNPVLDTLSAPGKPE